MQKYTVVTSITLGFGSYTQGISPTHNRTYNTGEILTLDAEAPNGNVWFIDKDNERGKIQSGCVGNLVNRGVLRPIE